MTCVAFRKEPCKANQLVSRPSLGCFRAEISWRRYVFPNPQLSQLLPSAEHSERVIRRRYDPMS